MKKRVQLLVHAGASSTRKGDEGYEAQVKAYMRIDATRVSRTIRLGHVGSPPGAVSTGHVEHDGSTTATDSLDPYTYCDDTQLAYTALESQLFTSPTAVTRSTPKPCSAPAPDVCKSVKAEKAGKRSERHQLRQLAHTISTVLQPADGDDRGIDSWRPSTELRGTVSYISTNPAKSGVAQPDTPAPNTSEKRLGNQPGSQSSYLVSPDLDRSRKRMRMEEASLANSDAYRNDPLPTVITSASQILTSLGVRGPSSFNEASEPALGSVSTDGTTSELPDSYSLSYIVPGSLPDSVPSIVPAISEPGFVATSLNDDPSYPIAQPEDVFHPVSEEIVNPIQTTVGQGTSTVSRTDPIESGPRNEEDTQAVLASLSMEIHAPGPKVSTKEFKTHITSELRHLATKHSDRFCPVSVSRTLATSERGFWIIHCAAWKPALQASFWKQLETYIGNGSLGWGIWCTRGPDEHVSAGGSSQPWRASKHIAADDHHHRQDPHHHHHHQHDASPSLSSSSSSSSFGPVRLYCWGESVKHTYLVLYVASLSRVRKLGLQWIDSAGKVVVQMQGGSWYGQTSNNSK